MNFSFRHENRMNLNFSLFLAVLTDYGGGGDRYGSMATMAAGNRAGTREIMEALENSSTARSILLGADEIGPEGARAGTFYVWMSVAQACLVLTDAVPSWPGTAQESKFEDRLPCTLVSTAAIYVHRFRNAQLSYPIELCHCRVAMGLVSRVPHTSPRP